MNVNNNFKRTKERLFYDGAGWVKVDFHLHSPYVHSFKLPFGTNLECVRDIDKLIDQYVQKLVENQIEVCAITDYQQIRKDWFVKLQSKAKENEIFVFPGVELSISSGIGIHILFIFEYDEDIDSINQYLRSLHVDPKQNLIRLHRKHIDIELKNKNIFDLIDEVKQKFNVIVILPHPEQKNGFLKEFQIKEAVKIIKYIDAIEYISNTSKNKLLSNDSIKKDDLRKLAILESSDPKSLDEIGNKYRKDKKRCTFLKLSSASIHAFKIALQDPELRVRLYKKPEMCNYTISSIKIDGSNFLKNVELNFNPELNTFIGGRGVGKSSILESIRYCLGLPYYSDAMFREDLVKNVVGSGGKITLTIHKKTEESYEKFTIDRTIGKEAGIKGTSIIQLEFYYQYLPIFIGQKELYHLSSDKEFQLNLIDEIIGDEIKKIQNEFSSRIVLLNENKKELLALSEKIKMKEVLDLNLKNIQEHIKTFEALGVAERMKLNTDLHEDQTLLNQNLYIIGNGIFQLENIFSDFLTSLTTAETSLLTAKSVEKNILFDVAKILKNFHEELSQKQIEINEILSKYKSQLQEIPEKWNSAKLKYEEEINQIKKQLSEKQLSPDKFEEMVRKKHELEFKLKSLSKTVEQFENIQNQREVLKEELIRVRQNLFEIRKDKINEINNKLQGKLQLEVIFQENKTQFKEKIKSLLTGSGVTEEEIDAIIKITPIDGIMISRTILEGKEKLKDKFNLTPTVAEKIYNWFINYKSKLYELETLFPEDEIKIKLKVDKIYKDFEKLSAGQKATALLILLFTLEDRILIIDQPEEDLDNRFIFDDIVSFLRSLKGKRQIIFATHNANIPVLGDAEQVIVLESDNEKGCFIKNSGSIDKVSITQDIKAIMEGGEEAFKLRIKKYGTLYE